MIVAVFGGWIIGAGILFFAQKPKERYIRIVLRFIGFLFLTYPFLVGIWGNYITPFFTN